MFRRHRYLLATLLLTIMTLTPREVLAEKRIGVLLFSNEARYHESLKGIKEQLAKAGYKEPKVTFVTGNAAGSKARAADLVRNYAADTLSLMITLGTNATIAAAKEIRDVPIVFSMVYDPIEARVAKDWKSSGTNVTGASPRILMTELVARLKEVRPVKRLAVLYTPGEKNSESQLKELQGLQGQQGVTVLPVIVAKIEEVALMLPEVLHSVDAVYLSGSSVVGSTIPSIVDLASKAKVITITHLEDLVKGGVMLGVCADPYQLGILAGKKAVAILQGAKPSSIPMEYLAKPGLVINMKTARQAQVQIPKSVLQRATKVFDE